MKKYIIYTYILILFLNFQTKNTNNIFNKIKNIKFSKNTKIAFCSSTVIAVFILFFIRKKFTEESNKPHQKPSNNEFINNEEQLKQDCVKSINDENIINEIAKNEEKIIEKSNDKNLPTEAYSYERIEEAIDKILLHPGSGIYKLSDKKIKEFKKLKPDILTKIVFMKYREETSLYLKLKIEKHNNTACLLLNNDEKNFCCSIDGIITDHKTYDKSGHHYTLLYPEKFASENDLPFSSDIEYNSLKKNIVETFFEWDHVKKKLSLKPFKLDKDSFIETDLQGDPLNGITLF
jgi:hypothetical protein